MRQLVIVCENSHAERIKQHAENYCHPALRRFVTVLPIDVGASGTFRSEHDILLGLVRDDMPGTSERPFVCYTREADKILKIRQLANVFNFDTGLEALSRLTKERNGDGSPGPLHGRLNQCGLSVRGGAVGLLRNWAHASIDRNSVDIWLNQFGMLGRDYAWIGEQILVSVDLIQSATLSDFFANFDVGASSVCINRDPRKAAKSGDFISTLIGKRHQGKKYIRPPQPAEAVEDESTEGVIVFEDGLWSGTEALGVIESLLGKRPADKLKTPALKDPSKFNSVDFVLAYGIATDYGAALVSRFLRDNGLTKARVQAGRILPVASSEALDQLSNGQVDLSIWRDNGPPNPLIPHVFANFAERGVEPSRIAQAKAFCESVGGQLFAQYLQNQARLHGWSAWPEQKQLRARLGMHGLGLTQAFGHSVPKASLPLLWASGQVSLGGRSVKWIPLFQNS